MEPLDEWEEPNELPDVRVKQLTRSKLPCESDEEREAREAQEVRGRRLLNRGLSLPEPRAPCVREGRLCAQLPFGWRACGHERPWASVGEVAGVGAGGGGVR